LSRRTKPATERPFWRRLWLGVALAGLIWLALLSFFVALVALVPLPRPRVPVATEVFDVRGRLATKLYVQNRIPVDLQTLPPYLPQAVVAIEDARFFRHRGVDPVALVRAAARNLAAGRVVEGGSTITQQLAKNLFLTSERTLRRKFWELVFTVKLERRFTKRELLELYLNQIYLGEGAYGVEVAALRYFGKSARDLTLGEAALLAGIVRSPGNLSPYRHPEAALGRRELVLDRMVELGLVSPDRAALARAEPLRLANAEPPRREHPWFVDLVVRELETRAPEVARSLYAGGFRVYTTMDLDLQRAAEAAVAANLPVGTVDERAVTQPQVALVAIDPRTGHLAAVIGGRDFGESQFNRAVLARRQPGSAFKPFVYAAALEAGHTPAALQTCEPVSFPAGMPGEQYTPRDYVKEGGAPYHYRPFIMRTAIQISDNVVAVRWAAEVGPRRVVELARRFGIESPLDPTLPLALGTSAVTPLELARAFSPLANGGIRVRPLAVLRVEDRQGRVLLEQAPELQPVYDPRLSFIMADLLKSVFWPGGTAAGVARLLDRPAAGKTGTTNELRDAWFVGLTPDLVAAVWVGNDDDRVPVGRTGGGLAAPIWAHFVRQGLRHRPAADWTPPPGVIRVAIDPNTGLLANATSPQLAEVFVAGTQPREVSPILYLGTEERAPWGTPDLPDGVPAPDGATGLGKPGEESEPPPPGGAGHAPGRDREPAVSRRKPLSGRYEPGATGKGRRVA